MKIKTRYIYTVVREGVIRNQKDLENDIDFFRGAMQDETGEYLYAGTGLEETITISMEISKNNGKSWEKVI